MNKKLIALVVILITSTLCLCGCEAPRTITITTASMFESNVTINIDEDYYYKDYQKTYSDDGKCEITIVYEKK